MLRFKHDGSGLILDNDPVLEVSHFDGVDTFLVAYQVDICPGFFEIFAAHKLTLSLLGHVLQELPFRRTYH